MQQKFEQYIEHPSMLETLKRLGFLHMTPVQALCLPQALQGKDLLVQAKTGSGKTLAFALPLLLKLDISYPIKLQACIITPTRELAQQVAESLRKVASFQNDIKIITLCGGTPLRPQAQSLQHGAHIIVGTPGRIRDHLEKETLKLESITTFVLDEADKMLQMGFVEEIEFILKTVPKNKQTLLFSATFPQEIRDLSSKFQKDQECIITQEEKNSIEELFYHYHNDALATVISQYQPKRAIIFCNTKIQCDTLEMQLNKLGYEARAMHSDLAQIDRDETLLCFKQHSFSFLIATDVASRGLDIPLVPMVINYDLPHDGAVYIHRIGRTGRIETEGIAVSFIKTNLPAYLENIQVQELKICKPQIYKAPFKTLCIAAGKRDKIRKTDILGAFIHEGKMAPEDIGNIDIFDKYAYVAIKKEKVRACFETMQNKKIKKKNFKLWIL
ncbi:MAG: ATP-dependent RNA helicase DbpA [Sulfurospirillum sp.]|nr:ATP-dependent RNA helicase DbpA [Sulfurospirillum sp.]